MDHSVTPFLSALPGTAPASRAASPAAAWAPAPAAPQRRARRLLPRVQVTARDGRAVIALSQRDDLLLVRRTDVRRLARALLRAARTARRVAPA